MKYVNVIIVLAVAGSGSFALAGGIDEESKATIADFLSGNVRAKEARLVSDRSEKEIHPKKLRNAADFPNRKAEYKPIALKFNVAERPSRLSPRYGHTVHRGDERERILANLVAGSIDGLAALDFGALEGVSKKDRNNLNQSAMTNASTLKPMSQRGLAPMVQEPSKGPAALSVISGK